MANPDLICEVRTEAGTFRDWLTVVISQSFASPVVRTFNLVVAEPSRDNNRKTASGTSWANAVSEMKLKPGDRVDIALAGQVVIQEGYIKVRQTAYDANRHGVQIEGYSKAGLTLETSAVSGTGQFRGYKVDAIANKVLEPLGLKFKVENGPEGWDTPFANVMIRKGESPFDLISRLANQRGLWIRADADGTLVGGTKEGGEGAMFEEGRNILSATCKIEFLGADKLIYDAQQNGSDSLFGKKAAEIQSSATLSGRDVGLPRIGLAEMPLSQKELQLRTNMEAQAIEASLLEVQLTYQGWLRPDGRLWNLTDPVTVKSPMLFPVEGGQMELGMWGYNYQQDAYGGTITTIDLVNKLAFGRRGNTMSGSLDDSFFQTPGPATPSGAT